MKFLFKSKNITTKFIIPLNGCIKVASDSIINPNKLRKPLSWKIWIAIKPIVLAKFKGWIKSHAVNDSQPNEDQCWRNSINPTAKVADIAWFIGKLLNK